MQLGVVLKKPGIFLNDPKSLFSFVFSYRFLTWWAPCRQEVWNFQLSVGVKASLVESQQMSSFVFISFHRLSFCIHFLSCSFHFAFISFHFALMSFHVPSLRCYVSKIQVFESWYAQTGQVGIRPNARVFFFIFRYRFCYRLAIVFEAYAGCHLQASWTCTCISSLSFFFTLIVCWAGNALAVSRCKPSENEMPGVMKLSHLMGSSI